VGFEGMNREVIGKLLSRGNNKLRKIQAIPYHICLSEFLLPFPLTVSEFLAKWVRFPSTGQLDLILAKGRSVEDLVSCLPKSHFSRISSSESIKPFYYCFSTITWFNDQLLLGILGYHRHVEECIIQLEFHVSSSYLLDLCKQQLPVLLTNLVQNCNLNSQSYY